MNVFLDLHLNDEGLPIVMGGDYATQTGCWASLQWNGVGLRLHCASPAQLIAMGVLLQARGEELEKALVANPAYTPTVAEALRHPEEFVAGFTETPCDPPGDVWHN